ncbi:protein-export chaperone SecB [Wenzhouxiangella sediminis]|jgi:preprotein translocase subunit SecB|uniref:Protein-export protein SecB n=1 Tax=Wenzhouxiangella sediminis TaxID=1792836 RepID=A0A3E1KAT1_9GAMM|nr:protein-export chaperone SecB [Wenzhouxiangella sediminis]RFF30940.1 protein-export chaperone SecB [Wenzhouxiangella sediminis]
MAEEENQQAAAGNEQEAQMAVQHVYLKDASFEAPNVLELNQSGAEPEVNLSLSQRSENVGEGRNHVVLSVTVTSKQGDKTAFLCEVQYGGFFQLTGFSEQQIPYVLNVLCPNVLFPYCRSQIGSMVSAGGFFMPPLQPVNFEAVFRQRLEEASQRQQAEGAESGGESE